MKREIVFSLILHLVVFALAVFSAPFDSTTRFDPGEVIRIRAVSMPDFSPPSSEPVAIAPPVVPQALPEEVPEIPISDPTTVTESKEIEKPKPQPQKPAKPETQPAEADAGGDGSGKKEIDVAGSGPGSPFAGATIDNASFDYPYWFTQTFNKLAANFRNTVVIDGRVVCVVYFQVLRSGRMVELRVEQSSGIPAFDRVCLTAVEKSAPFPPLPKDFRDEIIGISVPFTNSSR
ncbi:MAG: energy transducer TonB [Candidatus Zixiibacteriota bacterium]|nr:MAG: energy transducer TonB [candidate division Zixibacteria bacterium]